MVRVQVVRVQVVRVQVVRVRMVCVCELGVNGASNPIDVQDRVESEHETASKACLVSN